MEQLRDRLLTGWTITRVFYLLIGLFIIINALIIREYYGILFGAYALAMGLFRFGCAAGACGFGRRGYTRSGQKAMDAEVIFEEVNNK